MSPASHFFLFEKGEKINKWHLFTVVVKKHFRQTFCPAFRSRCIFKNSNSHERKVFFRDHMRSLEIACDCLWSLAIACDRMAVRSRVTYNKEDWIRLASTSTTDKRFISSVVLSPIVPPNSIATSRRIINYIAIPSVIASSYRPFHIVTRRHTLSHHTVTSLYHCCCHAT